MRRGGGVREAVALGAVLGRRCCSARARRRRWPRRSRSRVARRVRLWPAAVMKYRRLRPRPCLWRWRRKVRARTWNRTTPGNNAWKGAAGSRPPPLSGNRRQVLSTSSIHFYRAGICTITAESWRPRTAAEKEKAVYEEDEPAAPVDQTFVVAKRPARSASPPPQLPRATPPSAALTAPSVLTSEALFISFFCEPPVRLRDRLGVPLHVYGGN